MHPVRVARTSMRGSPFIAAILGVKDSAGRTQKSGYYYQLYLPTGGHEARAEPMKPALKGDSLDANAQEVRWCCYAWPNAIGQSGNRAFFVNQAGDVYASPNRIKRYSGTDRVPSVEAAFERAGTAPRNLDSGIGLAAAGLTSGDGGVWVPCGG